MRQIVFIFMTLLLVACTKGAKTPEGLIKKFASDIATKNLDMDYYEKFTTGEMLEAIKDVGLDEFEKKTRMVNVKDVKVSILNQSCEGKKCVITYRVQYNTANKIEGRFASEVKKVAEVEKSGEYWKLKKSTNLKTYHESNQAINPLVDQVPSGGDKKTE